MSHSQSPFENLSQFTGICGLLTHSDRWSKRASIFSGGKWKSWMKSEVLVPNCSFKSPRAFFFKMSMPGTHLRLLKSELLEIGKMEEIFKLPRYSAMGFPHDSAGKESACNAGDTGDIGLIPGSGRSPGGGHENPLLYSCLKNSTDGGA